MQALNHLPVPTKPSRSEAMKKYRHGRRRIDYTPDEKVAVWLDRMLAKHPAFSMKNMLDELVRHGLLSLHPEEAKETWPG